MSKVSMFLSLLAAALLIPGASAFAKGDGGGHGGRGGGKGGCHGGKGGRGGHGDSHGGHGGNRHGDRGGHHDRRWDCTYVGAVGQGPQKAYVRSGEYKDIFEAKRQGMAACQSAGLQDCKLVGCYPR